MYLSRQPHSSSTAVATLTCEEEVKTFHCNVQDAVEARAAVVGQDGGLFLYHVFTGQPPYLTTHCKILCAVYHLTY